MSGLQTVRRSSRLLCLSNRLLSQRLTVCFSFSLLFAGKKIRAGHFQYLASCSQPQFSPRLYLGSQGASPRYLFALFQFSFCCRFLFLVG
jgi:hypothetical protein